MVAHVPSIGCSGRRTKVKEWGFTCEAMEAVRESAYCLAAIQVSTMTTAAMVAEYQTPAEPRRMVKPERAEYEGRRRAIVEAMIDRGLDPSDYI
jgi:hypothetical protein